MSSQYRKIEYTGQGPYGSTEKKFLYIRYDGTCDTVSFYNEDGNYLFGFEEWDNFDMGKAIVVALTNFEDERLISLSGKEFKDKINEK